jgi:hypothetical protein
MGKSRNTVRQLTEERRTFERFLSARGIDASSANIQQPDPPAPDILWRQPSGERTAVELLEVRDRGAAQRLDRKLTAEDECWKTFRELSSDQQHRFNGRAIQFFFNEGTSAAQAARSSRDAIHHLLQQTELPRGSVSFDGILPKCIQQIDVRTTQLDGPMFDVASFGSFGDGIVASVEAKLTKKYTSVYSIELLVWYEKHGSATFEIHRREWLSALLSGRGGCQPFRRIWVFDAAKARILALHPESDVAALGIDLWRQEL